MFQKLVNHNDDIRRLVEKGYAVAFDSNYLVIRDIPYLDSNCELQIGAIVTKLEFVDQERVTQTDHQIFLLGLFLTIWMGRQSQISAADRLSLR